jgi:hypothetical protein
LPRDKPVFVYKLIVREGIEGAIELLKSRKAALAEAKSAIDCPSTPAAPGLALPRE